MRYLRKKSSVVGILPLIEYSVDHPRAELIVGYLAETASRGRTPADIYVHNVRIAEIAAVGG